MPSRGSQNPNWQRWIPKPVVIGQIGTAGNGSKKDATFFVPFPDSRLRVKISLLFNLNPVLPPSGSQIQPLLWLYESDVDDSGKQGDNVPLANVIPGVTSAAPLAIPVDPGLRGYTREFVSAADNIEGRFTITSDGFPGYWVLQTRYQPSNVTLPMDEWLGIIAQCNPSANKAVLP